MSSSGPYGHDIRRARRSSSAPLCRSNIWPILQPRSAYAILLSLGVDVRFSDLYEYGLNQTLVLSTKSPARAKRRSSGINDSPDDWYDASYQPILRAFESTRDDSLDSWAIRVALTFSWLPTVPRWTYRRQACERLLRLEQTFLGLQLGELNVSQDVYRFADRAHHEDERLLMLESSGGLKLNVIDALNAARDLLYAVPGPTSRIASITKLLHFSMPALLPILDRNIAKLLFGTSLPTDTHYLAFVAIAHVVLRNPDEPAYKDLRSRIGDTDLTPVRVFEKWLFDASRE